ncbi:MAG: hypothetical protein HQM02_09245 [Magnetococcales bacterium]|nr:hypothetical protein [Magnetococcales bacterium]
MTTLRSLPGWLLLLSLLAGCATTGAGQKGGVVAGRGGGIVFSDMLRW